jgi:hypothetical protein
VEKPLAYPGKADQSQSEAYNACKMFFEILATVSAGLFAGASIYINLIASS